MAFVLVVISKPRIVFDSDGRLRTFSCIDEAGTLTPLGVVTVVLAFLSYTTFCIMDALF
jgi:hypothetical protein